MTINFLVPPVVAWGPANLIFGGDPNLFVGMVPAGLFPTSGMTISRTGFAKGNVRAAVKMTVIGLRPASLPAPVYLLVLAGKVVDVDARSVLSTVLFVVIVPLAAGWATRVGLTRRLGKQRYQRVAPVFPGLSTVGVLGIVFIALTLKAQMIIDRPALPARIIVPVVAFNLINYLIAIVIGRLSVTGGRHRRGLRDRHAQPVDRARDRHGLLRLRACSGIPPTASRCPGECPARPQEPVIAEL